MATAAPTPFILIVDDVEDTRQLYSTFFQYKGFASALGPRSPSPRPRALLAGDIAFRVTQGLPVRQRITLTAIGEEAA